MVNNENERSMVLTDEELAQAGHRRRVQSAQMPEMRLLDVS